MDIVYAEKYFKQVRERFSYLSEKQIEKIVKYGLRSFFAHNKLGADVLLKSNYYTAYVGKLYNNMTLFSYYYNIKMKLKLRIKHKRKKLPFNGKYYFSMNEEDYQKYFGYRKPKQRKIKFEKLRIYKLYEELALYKPAYIFEFEHEDVGYSKRLKNITIRRMHLVGKKNKDGKVEPVSNNVKKNYETNSNKWIQRRT